jgi:hypothetical protein
VRTIENRALILRIAFDLSTTMIYLVVSVIDNRNYTNVIDTFRICQVDN